MRYQSLYQMIVMSVRHSWQIISNLQSLQIIHHQKHNQNGVYNLPGAIIFFLKTQKHERGHRFHDQKARKCLNTTSNLADYVLTNTHLLRG